jgi:hypothetical protein
MVTDDKDGKAVSAPIDPEAYWQALENLRYKLVDLLETIAENQDDELVTYWESVVYPTPYSGKLLGSLTMLEDEPRGSGEGVDCYKVTEGKALRLARCEVD